MNVRGWVYVLSNTTMPKLVKIGFSNKDPVLRAKDLNHTGLPDKFVVEYDVLVINPHELEQNVHKRLQDKRKKGKEFFECTLEEAIAVIWETCKGKILLENNNCKVEISAPNNPKINLASKQLVEDNSTSILATARKRQEMHSKKI
jgi:hypothetical protein